MTTADFRDRLMSGEKIIWSGRPAQGLLLARRDWLLIPFSLMYAGYAVFWGTSWSTDAPSMLFEVPFVLIILYFVAARFLHDAWIRRGMQYAITNKRVLISRSELSSNFISMRLHTKFTAMNLNRLPKASLTESANGRGTIRFGQPRAPWWDIDKQMIRWGTLLDPTPQFIVIENARNVFEQIQRAVKSDALSSAHNSKLK